MESVKVNFYLKRNEKKTDKNHISWRDSVEFLVLFCIFTTYMYI